ncbi:MAG: ABC transporter permease [Oscillospiraceae bacterium]|jgi:spermidine/putrescine transport system permease protein
MLRSRVVAVPYLVWAAVFIVVPLGLVCWFAFTDSSGQFTLQNLSSIGKYMPVFLKSISLAGIATVICLLIAFPIAYSISRLSGAKQNLMLMLIMLPMWMNFLLRTYAWMSLLENNGIINRLLGLIGLGPFQMINTQGAVVLGMVYNYLPFMIMPLYSIMTKIDNSVIEAARDLGARNMQIVWRVIVPLSVPGISTGIITVFVPSISTFIISRMLGGGGNLLIGDLIEMQFLGNSYNPHVGSAMALVLMVMVLLCLSIFGSIDTSEDDMEGMMA